MNLILLLLLTLNVLFNVSNTNCSRIDGITSNNITTNCIVLRQAGDYNSTYCENRGFILQGAYDLVKCLSSLSNALTKAGAVAGIAMEYTYVKSIYYSVICSADQIFCPQNFSFTENRIIYEPL